MKKIMIIFMVFAGIFTASFAYSQSSWIGTAHIAAGNVIRSAPLASNLAYLFNEKVNKPLQDCSSNSERLGWVDGVWTCEEYTPQTVTPAAACIFNGTVVEDGATIAAFITESVPFGESCTSQVRSCTDGTLSGSYAFSSCVEEQPGTCAFGGSNYAHNQTVRAYQSQTVPFGESCTSQVRSCADGTLSGSYAFSSCVEEQPQNCTFNGATIAHGETTTAYETGSVTAPATCTPQVRTCNNGVLSGSYTAGSCVVEPGVCAPQDLTFSYNAPIPGLGIITGSCVIPASLVENGDTGEIQAFVSSQCQNDQSRAPEGIVHNAECGLSGWELSSDVSFQTCDPTDAGRVVEVREFAPAAKIIQIDARCSCGVSGVGGEYGRNVTCLDRSGQDIGFIN